MEFEWDENKNKLNIQKHKIDFAEAKMRENYDFSKAIKNPYAKKTKKRISIRIDEDVVEYFKDMADNVGVPYQGLMNLFLRQVKTQELVPQFTEKNKKMKIINIE